MLSSCTCEGHILLSAVVFVGYIKCTIILIINLSIINTKIHNIYWISHISLSLYIAQKVHCPNILLIFGYKNITCISKLYNIIDKNFLIKICIFLIQKYLIHKSRNFIMVEHFRVILTLCLI